jgi:hypothetical protein
MGNCVFLEKSLRSNGRKVLYIYIDIYIAVAWLASGQIARKAKPKQDARTFAGPRPYPLVPGRPMRIPAKAGIRLTVLYYPVAFCVSVCQERTPTFFYALTLCRPTAYGLTPTGWVPFGQIPG